MSRGMEATKTMDLSCGEIRAALRVTKNHWEVEDRDVQPLVYYYLS
jgi:hypothetical protein